MAFKVNGGIINQQTLSGGMRFFKIVGPFGFTVSDGQVNLPVSVVGGATPKTQYFTVGNNRPVPNSAAEICLKEIAKQADIVIIGQVPSVGALTTEIDIGISSVTGWGSDYPDYNTAPANANEDQLPTTPTHAASEMQTAIRALAAATVYVSTSATFVATTGTGSTTMNISSVSAGTVAIGQTLSGGTLSGTATITAFGTFTNLAGTGTVTISATDTWANPTTVTATGNSFNVPITATASFSSVTVTEVSFSLGSLTYYTLA